MSQFNYKWPTELGIETEIPSYAYFSIEQVMFGAIENRKLPTAIKKADQPSIGQQIKSQFGAQLKAAFNFNDKVETPDIQSQASTKQTLAGIALPLPDTFFSNTNVAYSEANAGGVNQALIAAADGGSLSQVFESSVKGIISDVVRTLKPIGNAIAVTSGKVVNPFAFQIFQGVNTRKFTYTWNMVAKNEEESAAIKNICDLFQLAMLPKRDDDQAIHFLEIPYMFDVKYYYEGSLAKFYDQPQKCYLESVNITYGGETQNQQHMDGSPINVNLSLTFTEIQPIFREDNINGKSSYAGQQLLSNRQLGIQPSANAATYNNKDGLI